VEVPAEPSSSPSGLDAAFEGLDRVSARASLALFKFGIFAMLPGLVALVTLDVVLRYVFDAPLQWARDVSGLLLLMGICSALPHAWDRSYHIRMEVAYDRFPEKWKRLVDVLSSVSGIIFFGLMAVQAAAYVPFMAATGETGEDLLWPLWPYMAFMAFCALVTVARLVANPSALSAHHAPGATTEAPIGGGAL
jgi:TRAP-type C4-dicarboxylate transport system permease small subunit